MPNVLFLDDALAEFSYWAHNDRKVFDKINKLIDDIERNGAAKGIVKPEYLKHENAYSRRITSEHRLVYNVDKNIIEVFSCKSHYGDK